MKYKFLERREHVPRKWKDKNFNRLYCFVFLIYLMQGGPVTINICKKYIIQGTNLQL